MRAAPQAPAERRARAARRSRAKSSGPARFLRAVFAAYPLAACAGPAPAAGDVEVRAPIVRVSVRVAESFPPQYFADVVSALPDGCARFARTALRREGATLFVDVFNTRPAGDDVACTMIYGERETAIALGSEFTSGAAYTLDVNGTRQTFVAQ
jgi:hypothetical protein